MRRFLLRPEAEVGIANFFNQIRLRSSEKATDFLVEVDSALDKIEAQPRAYAVRYRDMRRINLASFPYALFYLVEEKRDSQSGENFEQIVVLLCLHQRQNLDAALQL